MTGDPRPYSSPPCMAGEFGPDPEQTRDVARWRQAERKRLPAERSAVAPAMRQVAGQAMARHLNACLEDLQIDLQGLTVSGWWPIRGEADLRPWLKGLVARGATAALPVVTVSGAPLVFRSWTAGSRMARGVWNIPVPADGADVLPGITLAPLVGWDADGFRLGYGGGFFDRTLAALSPRPRAIGIGFQMARLQTIFPQPHDVPMDAIVTEAGWFIPRRG